MYFYKDTLILTPVTMEKTTIRERILLHLSRYAMIDDREMFNLPFDLTQDGIASALGISRAHTSLELKKLRQAGRVKERQVRVIGSNVRRKVYHLEPEGREESKLVKERLDRAGVPVETILDMRQCDPKLMWDKLSESDRDVLGLACVIRIPIHISMLPPASSGVIPVTHKGLVNISTEVKNKYLEAADEESVRIWNSNAADWYIDNDLDDQERLYHLVKAGRSFESNQFLIRKSEEFFTNCNRDLMDIIKEMEDPVKAPSAAWSVRGRLAISCEDTHYARKCAEKLKELGSKEGEVLVAEIKYIEGDFKNALRYIEYICSKIRCARMGVLKGRLLFAMKEYDLADKILVGTMREFSATRDVSRLDEILMLRAGIAYKQGDTETGISLLNKAMHSARNDSRKSEISNMIKLFKSGLAEPMLE